MQIKIEYVDENDVPYALYDATVIVLTNDGKLYSEGTDSYFSRSSWSMVWRVPNAITGKCLNECMDLIADKLKEDYTYNDAEDIIGDYDYAEEIQHMIDNYIEDLPYALAAVFRADWSVMTNWFVNGESPEEIENYVKPKLVYEDYYVYFPDSPSEYREIAEEYYNYND